MKRILVPAILIPAYVLCMRLFPVFSCFWKQNISLPALRLLSLVGGCFSFSLLEWCVPPFVMLFVFRDLKRRFFRSIICILTVFSAIYLSVWYPLYFQKAPVYSASSRQFCALSDHLIHQLNNTDLQFEEVNGLPAKFIRFPAWMNQLKISGLCSFFTGEALITPELPAVSIPFVAVHERMHLDGHAGEGAANIAAWEECLARGGVYADSARIWALRYAMGILKHSDPECYNTHLQQMNSDVALHYREAGGAYQHVPLPPLQGRLFSLLGITAQVQDYENIALYLAAQFPQ